MGLIGSCMIILHKFMDEELKLGGDDKGHLLVTS